MTTRSRCGRHGFTLVEAAICSVVVALMGVAAGTAVASAGRAREELRSRVIANAAADRIMSEVLGKAFDDPQSPDAPSGLDDGESASDRSTFDDIDDYDGMRLSPATDAGLGALIPGVHEVQIEVSGVDLVTLERSNDRTGLAYVRVRVVRGDRVVGERVAFRARNAEASP